MSRFEYKGRDGSGEMVTGFIEVASSEAAASQLMNRGITPIAINEASEPSDVMEMLSGLLGSKKVRDEDLIMLTRQLYTITKAGLPLVRGIRGLANTMNHPVLKEALIRIGDDLETGISLSQAMTRHRNVFNSLYISMIRVGEDSGQLEAVFNQLSVYMERDLETNKQIKAALRYPSFVIIALVVAMGVVNVLVIPEFANMFAKFDSQLPLPTRILIFTSDFFVAWWPYLLVLAVAAWFGFKRYTANGQGAVWWGEAKLRIPIVGSIMNRALMARYCRAFSLMLRSGVPLTRALDLCASAVDNPYLGGKIITIKDGIERGDSLVRTHNASSMFTPLVLQMISVGEESGQVEELLGEVAEFYEREVDYDVKTLSARIEPIMIAVMAVFVLILALGIFLPMWNMYSVQQ